MEFQLDPIYVICEDADLVVNAEHEAYLPVVYNCFVLVAVIEQDMHLLRLAGKLANFARPWLEFFLGVEVVETLSRADTSLLPRLRVPTVEADQFNIRGYFRDSGYTRLESLGSSTHTNGKSLRLRKSKVAQRSYQWGIPCPKALYR